MKLRVVKNSGTLFKHAITKIFLIIVPNLQLVSRIDKSTTHKCRMKATECLALNKKDTNEP